MGHKEGERAKELSSDGCVRRKKTGFSNFSFVKYLGQLLLHFVADAVGIHAPYFSGHTNASRQISNIGYNLIVDGRWEGECEQAEGFKNARAAFNPRGKMVGI
jgi:hypothetical protein